MRELARNLGRLFAISVVALALGAVVFLCAAGLGFKLG